MANTPFMDLQQPTVGGDSGTWAPKLNSNNTVIDTHDHSTGKGVQIPTGGIEDEAVTYIKIQEVTAEKLLGRGVAGSGVIQEITLGTNLSMSGTTLNASGGGGGAQTLKQTLALGNVTDGYNIAISAGDKITLSNLGQLSVASNDIVINYSAAISGNANDIYLIAQSSNAANGNGGNIVFTPGSKNGSGTQGRIIATENIDMIFNQIIQVTDPTNPQDVATKHYVDGYNFSGAVTLAGDVSGPAGSNAIGTNKVTRAMLSQGTALTVIGRSANSTGNVADIAGTNNQVLRISGSVLGFGAIDLSTAQVTGVLPIGNQASQSMGGDVSGTTAAATIAKLQAVTLTVGTPGATQDGYVITYQQSSTSFVLKPAPGSGGGGSQTLAQTLVLGNSTGGTNISINSTDQVTGAGKLNIGSTTVNHTITGGQIRSVVTIASNLTLSDGYFNILVNTAAARSITLPTPVAGRKFIFFDVTGSANTNNITIVRNGSEKIGNVAASYIFTTDYGSFSLTSDGTDWMIGN